MLSTADTTRILIADHLGFDAVTDDQNLVADLALDSLDRVDLTVTLEQEFDIKIDDAALEEWQTVGDVVKTVEDVVIEHDPDSGEYWVSLPRRGRPVNIGPTYRGPGEFRTIPEALAYFKRVDAAMERFYA